jgi:hypothetical protein
MLVSPNTETDDDSSDDEGDGEQHWPNLQNPSDCGLDEESGECQHKSGFEYPGDEVSWWFQ